MKRSTDLGVIAFCLLLVLVFVSAWLFFFSTVTRAEPANPPAADVSCAAVLQAFTSTVHNVQMKELSPTAVMLIGNEECTIWALFFSPNPNENILGRDKEGRAHTVLLDKVCSDNKGNVLHFGVDSTPLPPVECLKLKKQVSS